MASCACNHSSKWKASNGIHNIKWLEIVSKCECYLNTIKLLSHTDMINNIPKSLLEAAISVLSGQSQHPMIDVDGVMKHRNNSLGKPIYHTDEGIRNFHRWFGNSKAVDDHGRPMVLYHGTSNDFKEFDPLRSNLSNRFGPGSYFTGEKSTFDAYSGGIGGNVMPVYLRMNAPIGESDGLSPMEIHKFFDTLKVKKFQNGYDATADHEKFKSRALENPEHAVSTILSASAGYIDNSDFLNGMKAIGRDGFIRKVFGGNEYVIHSPDQVKSAIGNDSTFDHPTSITESTEHPISSDCVSV